MALTLRERCESRLTAMKRHRLQYEPEWREIARYTMASRSRFLMSDSDRNFKRTNRGIYNSHGILSLRTLAGGMTSGLSSPSRPWLRLKSYNEDLMDDADAAMWFAEAERRLYSFFAGTNFYQAAKFGYGELGMFGTEACVMVENDAMGAVCHGLTAGEYWAAIGNTAMVDTLYRRAAMSVRNAVEMFKENVSPRIQTKYDSSNYDDVCEIIHAIEPNDEQDITVRTARGKPWRSIWWDAQDGDKANGHMDISGYEEQPFWCPRWETSGGDTYGTSPGMDALPDLRELQLQTKRKTEATAFLVKPEKIVPPNVKLTGQAGNIVSASSVDAEGIKVPYQMPYQAIGEILNDIERCTRAVDALSYADLFMAITNMQGIQPRNIEEIASRNEEKLTQLGPVIERVNGEKLEIAIDRAFGIMSRKGMLPPPPDSIAGAPIKVDFVSILAQMQRMVGIGQLERTVGFIGNLAAAFPEAGDKLNVDEAIDEFADRAGAPPKIIRSAKDVEAIRAGRAQQQQMQQMASMMPAARDGAEAARLMSEVAQNQA